AEGQPPAFERALDETIDGGADEPPVAHRGRRGASRRRESPVVGLRPGTRNHAGAGQARGPLLDPAPEDLLLAGRERLLRLRRHLVALDELPERALVRPARLDDRAALTPPGHGPRAAQVELPLGLVRPVALEAPRLQERQYVTLEIGTRLVRGAAHP